MIYLGYIRLFKSVTYCFVGLTIFHEIFPHWVYVWRIFHGILSIPQNIVMDLNNVMWATNALTLKEGYHGYPSPIIVVGKYPQP